MLVAPYSGYYTFYVAADDACYLYGSKASSSTPGTFESEVALASLNSYVHDRSYYRYAGQISAPVALKKNERFLLRFRTVNIFVCYSVLIRLS